MPTSGLALSRTTKQFTDHLKNFELGTITETNPSNGVYRYTFADGASPYTWAQVGGFGGNGDADGYTARLSINVGHVQMNNDTDSGGGYSFFDSNFNNLHFQHDTPKTDAASYIGGVVSTLPDVRNKETSGNFTSYLGGSAVTQGYNFSAYWNPGDAKMRTSSPITINVAGRYVEINWNQIALNETVYTTSQRNFGRTLAGKVKLVFQPYIYFDSLTKPEYAVYYGKPRYYNTTIAGTSLATLQSSPPPAISTFSNNAGTRTFNWTETTANYGNPYFYLWKWNGSTYVQVREGYLSNGSVAWQANSTKSANYNSYTIPSGDGSGYFYIYVYQYDGYYSTYSSSGTYSGDIFV